MHSCSYYFQLCPLKKNTEDNFKDHLWGNKACKGSWWFKEGESKCLYPYCIEIGASNQVVKFCYPKLVRSTILVLAGWQPCPRRWECSIDWGSTLSLMCWGTLQILLEWDNLLPSWATKIIHTMVCTSSHSTIHCIIF